MFRIIILCCTLFFCCDLFGQSNTEFQKLINSNMEKAEKIDQLTQKVKRLERELQTCKHTSSNPPIKIQSQLTTNTQKRRPNRSNSELKNIKYLQAKVRQDLKSRPSSLAANMSIANNDFDIYVIDLSYKHQELKFFWKDKQGVKYSSLGRLEDTYERSPEQLLFSTNGGMYNPSQDPQGLLIQDGEVLRGLDVHSQGNGNFYLMPNGIFLIDKNGKAKIVKTETYRANNMVNQVANATQSGPMLVIDGEYHTGFNPSSKNLNLRSGVGIIDEDRIVFAISKGGVSFYDFATLFKEVFGCKNALFLDGAVSQMYCPELSRYDRNGPFGVMIGLIQK